MSGPRLSGRRIGVDGGDYRPNPEARWGTCATCGLRIWRLGDVAADPRWFGIDCRASCDRALADLDAPGPHEPVAP